MKRFLFLLLFPISCLAGNLLTWDVQQNAVGSFVPDHFMLERTWDNPATTNSLWTTLSTNIAGNVRTYVDTNTQAQGPFTATYRLTQYLTNGAAVHYNVSSVFWGLHGAAIPVTANGGCLSIAGVSSADGSEMTCCVSDATNNWLTAGTYHGSVDFGGIVQTAAHGNSFIAKYNPVGKLIWVGGFVPIENGTDNQISAIAVDSAGDVYVTGRFRGLVNFGVKREFSQLKPFSNIYSYDIFIAKYSGVDGHWIWDTILGSGQEDSGTGITIDTDGNPVFTGYYSGRIGSLQFHGLHDAILGKLDSTTGVGIWTNGFGANFDDQGVSVATYTAGGPIIAGYFSGSVDFGGITKSSKGDQDVFVAWYDNNGAVQWVTNYGFAHTLVYPKSVAVSKNGAIALTGTYGFGFLPICGTNLPAQPSAAIFIASLTNNGVNWTGSWARNFGGSTGDSVDSRSIAINDYGTVFAAGTVFNPIDFGGGLLFGALTTEPSTDAFMASYGSNGSYHWASRFGGAAADVSDCIALSTDQLALTVTGYFTGTPVFRGSILGGALPVVLNLSNGQNGYMLFLYP